jgi:hypothetical protein
MKKIRHKIKVYKEFLRLLLLKRSILSYFKRSENLSLGNEYKNELAFLKNHPLHIFPHVFSKKYDKNKIEVFNDPNNGLSYVLFQSKRLYFKRNMTIEQIKKYFNWLLIEQDLESPHRYLDGSFDVEENDVVVDVGSAEGNFSLSIVEKAKAIYLFEVDPNWIEPLNATFKPWETKVKIIQTLVSDFDDSSNTRLDTFMRDKNEKIDFIKIDVEGFEEKILDGLGELLVKGKIKKIGLCTYHKQGDDSRFKMILEKIGYAVNFSSGYMLFYFDKAMKAPFFRRGLIRAEK